MRPLTRARFLALATIALAAAAVLHGLTWLPFHRQPGWVAWECDPVVTVILIGGFIVAAGGTMLMVRRRGGLPGLVWVGIAVVALYAALLLTSDMRASGGRVPCLTPYGFVAEAPGGRQDPISIPRFITMRVSYLRGTTALSLGLWVVALALCWSWGRPFAVSAPARWAARAMGTASCLVLAWGLAGLLAPWGRVSGALLAAVTLVGVAAWVAQALRDVPTPTRVEGTSLPDVA